MKSSSKVLSLCAILFLLATLVVSCDLFLSGEANVDIQARILTPDNKTVPQSKGETDVNLTPSAYKMAVTYFALIKDDGTEVKVTEKTDSDPLIVDFSKEKPGTLIDFFDGARLPRGKYVGYKIRFLYMEMKYPAAFHVPATICVTDSSDSYVTATSPTDYTFRQYFNTISPFWKRDFVVEKPVTADPTDTSWFWLRREVDTSHTSFFINSETVSHPAGGAGPDNILDLFANDAFWGDSGDYDDPSVLITIESGDATGGLDASMEEFTLKVDTVLLLDVDISNCMNYKEDQPAIPPSGITFTNNVMDLGPTYDPIPIGDGDAQNYGDRGFHPFMPKFKMAVHKK